MVAVQSGCWLAHRSQDADKLGHAKARRALANLLTERG